MKCGKDTALTVGLLLSVVIFISGMGFDQIQQIRADQERTEDRIENDLSEIKTDITIIRDDIKIILRDMN